MTRPVGSADPLVASALRLHDIDTERALVAFALDTVVAWSDATRVMLVFNDHGAPRGERAAALLAAIGPWLADARRERVARLRHGPDGAARPAQLPRRPE